ncbi:hypothetical protein ACFQV4_35840 [Streptomyces thermocarboxydus]
MSITAQLRDSVRLPGGRELVSGFALEDRRDDPYRALLRNGHELEVYDLRELFSGSARRRPSFLPWPRWDQGVHSVSPDGTFAVFSGQRSVRAMGADGKTLWEYRHSCWGPELDHPHTGDEQEVCRGSEHGSCRISDDGRSCGRTSWGNRSRVTGRSAGWSWTPATDGNWRGCHWTARRPVRTTSPIRTVSTWGCASAWGRTASCCTGHAGTGRC